MNSLCHPYVIEIVQHLVFYIYTTELETEDQEKMLQLSTG